MFTTAKPPPPEFGLRDNGVGDSRQNHMGNGLSLSPVRLTDDHKSVDSSQSKPTVKHNNNHTHESISRTAAINPSPTKQLEKNTSTHKGKNKKVKQNRSPVPVVLSPSIDIGNTGNGSGTFLKSKSGTDSINSLSREVEYSHPP